MDSIQTTIRLPGALLDALREEAERRGISFNALAVMLLWRGMRESESGH